MPMGTTICIFLDRFVMTMEDVVLMSTALPILAFYQA